MPSDPLSMLEDQLLETHIHYQSEIRRLAHENEKLTAELLELRGEIEALRKTLAATERAMDAYAKGLADSEELLKLNEEQDIFFFDVHLTNTETRDEDIGNPPLSS